MRKVRIGYFISFIIFIILVELMIFFYLEKFTGGILRSNFAFVVFLLPMLAVFPLVFLILEFINISREKKALKSGNVATARFLEDLEVKNLLYRAYKVRFSWKNSKGKTIKTWSQSNFTKEQVKRLKHLVEFDIFNFEDRIGFIKLNKLNAHGEVEGPRLSKNRGRKK